ncbi:hypothetical protein [Acidiphilium acidophilum]|uniref:hypothetical protein n=1 Tax=Acidiphilium acidophilum TaxID=76588 RepID=UPI002E8E6A33|nr:hypothetical protein [Acidiphilium acidophilum]
MKMAAPVYAQVKITGALADKLRAEAAQRRLSLNALATEYTLLGLEAPGPEDDALAGVERRIVSTLLASRGDVDTLSASVDILAALVDTLAKMLLVHLPEPSGDEREAIGASALARYEKLLAQTANTGFDEKRPRAIQRIAELLLGRCPAPEADPGE